MAVARISHARLCSLRAMLAGLAAALGPVACAQPAPLSVTFLDTAPISATSTLDQHGQSVTITGLSGIVWLGNSSLATIGPGGGPASNQNDYLAILDNSNALVRLRVQLNAEANAIESVAVLGAIRFDQSRDWEAIAAGPRAGHTLLAEEGTPSIAMLNPATGQIAWTAAAPPPFQNRRPNRGFESLTTDPHRGIAWTANEEALTTDGPAASPSTGTVVRLLRWNVTPIGATPGPQHAYLVDRMPGATIPGGSSGLSELLLLDDGRLLALERSLSLTSGLFRNKLYEVGLDTATNVASIPALTAAPFVPASKRLLWEGSVQNLEGLCQGPRLRDGRTLLIGVVDDGDPVSVNTVVALSLRGQGPRPGPTVRAASD